MIDLAGYAAAVLVALSLAARTPLQAKALAAAGGTLLAAYGVLTAAWPVAVAGVVFAVVSAWWPRGGTAARPPVAAIAVEPESPFVIDFLGAHAVDIQVHQPEYHPAPEDRFVRVLTRDGLPAGILVAEPAGRELLIKLDYVTPAYRDSQIARWLFGQGRRVFTDAGFSRLVAEARTSAHRGYLEFLGFEREGGSYVLDLNRTR